MPRQNLDPWKPAGFPRRTPVAFALALLAFLLVAPELFAAYGVRLKDGSLVLARVPYTIKGTRAIITLENGIVTQILLDEVDAAGTERYNRENKWNVIAIPTPPDNAFHLPARAARSSTAPSESKRSVAPVLRSGPAVRGARPLTRRD